MVVLGSFDHRKACLKAAVNVAVTQLLEMARQDGWIDRARARKKKSIR